MGYDLQEIFSSPWIQIKTTTNKLYLKELLNVVDVGEAEAIVLAKELHAQLLLTDDMKAKMLAKKEGLEIVGTLGILLRSKNIGLISNIRQSLDALIHEANFRISESLYQEILRRASEK